MTAAAVPQRRDAARPQRMLALLALLPVAALSVFILGTALGVRGQDLTLLALALLTAAVCFVPLIIDQGRSPALRHIFLSLFCLMFIPRFVLPIFLYYIPATGPVDAPGYASSLLPRDLARGQLAVLLGLVTIMIGYTLPLRRLFPGLPRVSRDWRPVPTVAVAAVMTVFGWCLLMGSAFGLIPKSFGSGVLGSLALWYIYGNILLTLAVVVQRVRAALVILAATLVATSLFGLFAGAKGTILIGPALVVITHIFVTRRIPLRWVVIGFFAVSIVYPVGMYMRQVVLAENTLTAADSLRNPGLVFNRLSAYLSDQEATDYLLEGFQSASARLDYVGAVSTIVRDTGSRVPFQEGRTLMLFPALFVPRILWAGKPNITIGQWITDHYGPGPQIENNLGPSLLGDFYMNFGYLGIIAGMLLYGATLRFAHEVLMSGKTTVPGIFIAVVLFREVTLGFGGGVAASYGATITGLLPIVFLHLVVTRLFPAPLSALGGAGMRRGAWSQGAAIGRRTSTL